MDLKGKNSFHPNGGGQNRLERGYKTTSIIVGVFLVALGMLVAAGHVHAAALQEWVFDASNPPSITSSDPDQFVFASGALQLKSADQTDSISNQFGASTLPLSNFDNTFVDLFGLRVASSLTLPDGGLDNGWTDMTGNALLLHMDEAPVKDSSGQGNSPTCTGASCPQMAADGKLGTALWFNGTNNYLVVPGTWGGAGWLSATIEAWVRVDDVTTVADKMQAIVSANAGQMFLHFQMLPTGDGFNVAVYGSNNYAIVSYDPSKPKLALKTWHHLAVTATSGSIILYADGQEVGNSSSTLTAAACHPRERIPSPQTSRVWGRRRCWRPPHWEAWH